MRGTRFGGSPRARFRSKSARRPLCANLIVAIVSRSGTFYSAAKSPDARQPTAERLHDRGALRRGRGSGDGARLAPAHRRCARGRRTGRRPTATTLRRPAPRPRRLLRRRPERVARDRRGGGTSDRAPARPLVARARPERTPPPALGCTTSRARRTWCPRPDSTRSPPLGTSPRPPSATAWSGSGAIGSARLRRGRPTSSAPCSPTGAASRAWCFLGNSSGTTIHRPAQTPRWPARASDRPSCPYRASRRTAAPRRVRVVAHPVRGLMRPCGDRAPKRPANRREAGEAPAIGIEARKGRDSAPLGLGAKHESPAPKGHRPERKPEKPSRGHGRSCAREPMRTSSGASDPCLRNMRAPLRSTSAATARSGGMAHRLPPDRQGQATEGWHRAVDCTRIASISEQHTHR